MNVDLVHAGGGGRTQAGSSRHWEKQRKKQGYSSTKTARENHTKLGYYNVQLYQSSFLGSATFSVGDLLRAKDERLTLSLRL
ncbi:hypothetical protein F7725_005869 [Dissostichus mawsoni]|uniref:Uncharacterized protein n=1 Tax=Dissostichus mawsoni TaxID=36200 RepID=A0A7J5YSG9_DISMA|nr:hypothetical protein F7725_005869 [Dissostichus mawsoni]